MSDYAGSSQTSRPPSVGQGPSRVERPSDPRGEARSEQQNSPPSEAPPKSGKSETSQHHYHDPAVALAPSIAHIEPGASVEGEIAQVDADGRPILRSGDALYALRPDAGLNAGDRVHIRVVTADRTLEGELVRRNSKAVEPPVHLQLTLVGVAGRHLTAAAADPKIQTEGRADTAALYKATQQALARVPVESVSALFAFGDKVRSGERARAGEGGQTGARAQAGANAQAAETTPEPAQAPKTAGHGRIVAAIDSLAGAVTLADTQMSQNHSPPSNTPTPPATTTAPSPATSNSYAATPTDTPVNEPTSVKPAAVSPSEPAANTGAHGAAAFLPPVLRGTVLEAPNVTGPAGDQTQRLTVGANVTVILVVGQKSAASSPEPAEKPETPRPASPDEGKGPLRPPPPSASQNAPDQTIRTVSPPNSGTDHPAQPGAPVVLRVNGVIEAAEPEADRPVAERAPPPNHQQRSDPDSATSPVVTAPTTGPQATAPPAAILHTPVGRVALYSDVSLAVGTTVTALLVADTDATTDDTQASRTADPSATPSPDPTLNAASGSAVGHEVPAQASDNQAGPADRSVASETPAAGTFELAAPSTEPEHQPPPPVTGPQVDRLIETETARPPSPPPLVLNPVTENRPATAWPALKTVETAVAEAGTQAQAALNERTLTTAERLPNVLMFLLHAAGRADPKAWLGALESALISAGQESALEQLQDDISRILTTATQTGGEWRAIPIPAQSDETAQLIYLLLRQGRDGDDGGGQGRGDDPAKDSAEDEKGRRFVLHVDFTSLGPVQLDGRLEAGRLDLTVHSERSFSAIEQTQARSLFSRVMERQNLAGQLVFHDTTGLAIDIGAALANTAGESRDSKT